MPKPVHILHLSFPAIEPCPVGSSCACSALLGSGAQGAGALKVTPEGVEHSVQLPEPQPEATEAVGKRSAAFGRFWKLLDETLVRLKGKSRLLRLHFYR